MATTFTIDALFTSCVLLSRFEGREQKDAEGKSLFERIVMQDRDKALVSQYLFEAALDINKYLVVFSSSDLDIEDLTWTWKDSYDVPNGVEGLIERYLINWALAAWLEDKAKERAEYYKGTCVRLVQGIVNMINRKKPV